MTKRLFTGFKISPEPTLLTYYQALQSELKDERIKWVEPWNMHITLWFFGDTEIKEIPAIKLQLQQACNGISPFTVKVKGCGSFGQSGNPSVIWFGLEIPELLQQLHKQIKVELSDIGILGDGREYKPHLTMGRIKGIKDMVRLKAILRTMKDLEFQLTNVNSFELYESQLTPNGPRYIELEVFKFGN